MLRVSILLYEEDDDFMSLEAELLSYLRKAGFTAGYASKSLRDLDMDPEKVAEFVSANPSDAWVVIAASGQVLEWFSMQPFPTLAMFGKLKSFPVAGVGPSHTKPLEECIDRLIELRHNKIVMFTRKENRQPKPGVNEQILLNALQSNNSPIDQDTLPEWEESLKGFRTCLESLFRKTPPTAIIVQETPLKMVAMQFLKERGLTTPGHVSSDKEDITHTIFDSKFIEGSTIGPPPSDGWNKRTEGKVW